MKVLGFMFDCRPSVSAHVEYTISKFRRSLWSLNHLRRANMQNDVLLRVYCTMLRPVVEFCSVVYHPMLTLEMDNDIERLQKTALKIIYGFTHSYEVLLELSGICTLKQRREQAFRKFSATIEQSERFNHWLTEVGEGDYDLRRRKKYEEQYARTVRLYNSPLYAIRRLLNEDE